MVGQSEKVLNLQGKAKHMYNKRSTDMIIVCMFTTYIFPLFSFQALPTYDNAALSIPIFTVFCGYKIEEGSFINITVHAL